MSTVISKTSYKTISKVAGSHLRAAFLRKNFVATYLAACAATKDGEKKISKLQFYNSRGPDFKDVINHF